MKINEIFPWLVAIVITLLVIVTINTVEGSFKFQEVLEAIEAHDAPVTIQVMAKEGDEVTAIGGGIITDVTVTFPTLPKVETETIQGTVRRLDVIKNESCINYNIVIQKFNGEIKHLTTLYDPDLWIGRRVEIELTWVERTLDTYTYDYSSTTPYECRTSRFNKRIISIKEYKQESDVIICYEPVDTKTEK